MESKGSQEKRPGDAPTENTSGGKGADRSQRIIIREDEGKCMEEEFKRWAGPDVSTVAPKTD